MEAQPPLMLCEYLGAKSGPAQAFPSKNNRCKADKWQDKLPLEKQSELCLGPGHLRCPLWLKTRTKEFSPPLGSAEALPPGQQDKAMAGEYKAGKKHRPEPAPAEEEALPDSAVFTESGGEFEKAAEEQEPPRHQPAKSEPVSQPFRHEMDDWMKGLFKDLRGK